MTAGVLEPTFADIDEAIEAKVRPVRLYVRIGGTVVNATEAHTRHGWKQLIGTCTIHCAAPRTEAMTINAEIEIEAGYPGAVHRIFHGKIPDDESVTDDRGHMLRIDGVGWSSQLAYPSRAGIEITGEVSLKDVFRSLCELRGIPTYLSDDTDYVGGGTIMLGGNEFVNGGHVRIDSRTSPGDWLRRVPPLFGYHAFDSPDGAVRLARISGRPPWPGFTASDEKTFLAFDWMKLLLDFHGMWPIPDITDPGLETVGVRYAQLLEDAFFQNGFLWGHVRIDDGREGYVIISGDPIDYYRVEKAIPNELPMHYQEGVNCYRLQRIRDREPMETFIEVQGARFTSADGGPNQIRSIPDEVPFAPELDPPGYRGATYSSQDLVTETQALGARNALEVDHSEVYEPVSWECAGRPDLQPGDVVTVTGHHHDLAMRFVWLTSIDQSVTDRGYISRMTGWMGAGTALPAANDCTTVSVGTGTYHLGNETLSHYRKPVPNGTNVVIPITVIDADYSSLRVIGLAHGSNSRSRGGLGNHLVPELMRLPFFTRSTASSIGQSFARDVLKEGYGSVWNLKQKATEKFEETYTGYRTLFRQYLDAIVADSRKSGSRATTGSQIEIWQKPEPSLPESATNEKTRVGTLTLPTLDEELNLRRNYASSNRFWTSFSLPVSGRLKEGAAELLLVAGKVDEGFDDYEIINLRMVYCGVGLTELPGEVG